MRRSHLVILDMVAKLAWLTLAVAVFSFAGIWFASAVQLTNNDILALRSGVLAVIAVTLIQAVVMNVSALMGIFAAAAMFCIGTWVLLEAFVRGGVLPLTDQSFMSDASHHFRRYLWAGLLRRSILSLGFVLAVLIGLGPLLTMPVGQWAEMWPDVRGAAFEGLGILVCLAFGLMTLETLIRSNVMAVVGLDLGRVLAIILVLSLVEAGVIVAALALSVLIMQWIESLGGLILTGLLLTVLLSVFHSYMLLVRYSAVDIVRRDIHYGATTEHASDL